ncbi:hypothetical protein TrRE_jg13607, partial [Triparma retinervis]
MKSKVESALGYRPGNIVGSAGGSDAQGYPNAIELYPLAVRGVLVKPKKGGDSGNAGVVNGKGKK